MAQVTVGKVEELRSGLSGEALELFDKLLTTRHANGDFVVSAPALAQLFRAYLKCDIGKDSVWRYRKNHLDAPKSKATVKRAKV